MRHYDASDVEQFLTDVRYRPGLIEYRNNLPKYWSEWAEEMIERFDSFPYDDQDKQETTMMGVPHLPKLTLQYVPGHLMYPFHGLLGEKEEAKKHTKRNGPEYSETVANFLSEGSTTTSVKTLPTATNESTLGLSQMDGPEVLSSDAADEYVRDQQVIEDDESCSNEAMTIRGGPDPTRF